MAHPHKELALTSPLVDLTRQLEELEREMTVQRVALDRLKQLRWTRPHLRPATTRIPVQRSPR